MKKIYVYGASGHGKVVADIALMSGYSEVIFVDDGENEHKSFTEIAPNLPIALGIGDNSARAAIYDKLIANGFEVVRLIHPTAMISPFAMIEEACVVMAGAIVNHSAYIDKGAIVNTAAVVEHDTKIGTFAHISPNTALAGGVTIGRMSHIGIGSSVIQNITIGEASVIGAGSVVVSDIKSGVVAYGNPCRIKKDGVK